MSAVVFPLFGNPSAAHKAACGNATFRRAIAMEYSNTVATAFAREAKRECTDWESPEACAFRLVRPKFFSATVPGYVPGPRIA